MQRFDCLSPDCPLFGMHLLEASAGTGKTFSIEHVFVRLLLASQEDRPIEAEQILAVTFTRAAARDLKARIRANLEKALQFLSESDFPEGAWEYLRPFKGSLAAVRTLGDALASFDQSSIFTIHGFCWRMLQEFAFEAKGGFSLPDPDGGVRFSQRLEQAARDFLAWGISEEDLCPEQMAILLKKFSSVDEIAERLLRVEEFSFEKAGQASFSTLRSRCKAALHNWMNGGFQNSVEETKLLGDFAEMRGGYKSGVKGDFERQVRALAQFFADPDSPLPLRALLRERGTLFEFLDPANRKVKATPLKALHYPGFFDWAKETFAPLIQDAEKHAFAVLQAAWRPIAEKILAEENGIDPDEILHRMRRAIEMPAFAQAVKKKYAAAIIDEFQDTDALQWEIFRRLFIEDEPLRALYLVGDPKQSIYRFRKADVYIYLQARDLLGEKNVYCLDTNFRSSKELVGALNALFDRDWLHLPKAKRTLPYLPVKAGADREPLLPDGKGALHFLQAEEPSNEAFDNGLLPYTAAEIARLLPQMKSANSFAVLVKDRYQAEKALEVLRAIGLPAVARSHTPLGQTLAFQAIEELFQAIEKPNDLNFARIVLAGPFGGPSGGPGLERIFGEGKSILEERGLPHFFRFWMDFSVDGRSLRERAIACGSSFYADLMQIFELLFAWEKREGFSFEGLSAYLALLKELPAEKGGRRRMEAETEAVQVMTLHASKGLEFDVVFALGLSARSPESEEETEELNAEKQRLLYVAMTRAKRRLYAPLLFPREEAADSMRSPIELFCGQLAKEAPLEKLLQELAEKASITCERLSIPFELPPAREIFSSPPISLSSTRLSAPFSPSYLSSFTFLAKTKESEVAWSELPDEEHTIHTLPRGAETGIIVHRIFERVFSADFPLWRSPREIDLLIGEELRDTPLLPWREAILQSVRKTLALPLQTESASFCLADLEPGQLQVEMEFLFDAAPDFIKGFIDLVFCHRGTYYLVDWKTNWLGLSDADYAETALRSAMESHDYPLQASLYAEALRRHLRRHALSPFSYGGAFYFFVRGGTYFHLPGSKT